MVAEEELRGLTAWGKKLLCSVVPLHATSHDKDTSNTELEHKTRQESIRKYRERATVCGHTIQNYSLLVGCPAFASPFHLLSLKF